MTSGEKAVKRTWTDLVNEPVHTSDDIDIGDIDAVNRDFIVVKRGFVNVHYYYIPITKAEGWDGNVLWLKIPEEKVVTKYEIDDRPPDPSRYYVKDHPMYTTAYYPELIMIPSRLTRPTYTYENNNIPTNINSTQTGSYQRVQSTYVCDLCGEFNFKTQDELTNHVRTEH
jgi:hypothetical protein